MSPGVLKSKKQLLFLVTLGLLVVVLSSAGWSLLPPTFAGAEKVDLLSYQLQAVSKDTQVNSYGLQNGNDSPAALGTVISFQGQLYQSGAPVNGTCDFQFGLWTALSGPAQVGATQSALNLVVSKGLFLVDTLDFGANAFNGDPRWIEVAIRCPAGSGGFTTLTPRLPIRPAPYALYASDSDRLDGLHASSFLSTSGGTINGNLSVNGMGHFYLNGGEISMSTPGGWPGLIMLSPNGHRRDLILYNDMLQLLVTNTSAAPTATSGITINESGYLGVGTYTPATRLDVSGDATFRGLSHFYLGGASEISMSTPGGWPGMIMKAVNGHRRDLTIRDDVLQLTTSSSSAAPSPTNGISINESGYVGIGTDAPASRLDVSGATRTAGLTSTAGATISGDLSVSGLGHFYLNGGEISMSTPGGWPGMIMYSPNQHRRDLVVYDNMLQLLVSSTNSPPSASSGITINENGNLGVGTWAPQARLDVNGTARAGALVLTGGGDLAEPFDITGAENIQPGWVVVIDEAHPGQLRPAGQPYDRKVAGCISGANGLQPGLVMQQEGSAASGEFPVALSGRVYCWADASFGAIQPGDLLTTSPTPGHIMLASDPDRASGAILGKAMSSLAQGRGLVLVLVSLQ